jgi:hypothetical protein
MAGLSQRRLDAGHSLCCLPTGQVQGRLLDYRLVRRQEWQLPVQHLLFAAGALHTWRQRHRQCQIRQRLGAVVVGAHRQQGSLSSAQCDSIQVQGEIGRQ